jgi:hypothetical protein
MTSWSSEAPDRSTTKASILDGLEEERDEAQPIERQASEWRVQELGSDAALITYRLRRRETPDGAWEGSLRSSVWRRVGPLGRWCSTRAPKPNGLFPDETRAEGRVKLLGWEPRLGLGERLDADTPTDALRKLSKRPNERGRT